MLTDAHHLWVKDTFDVDPRQAGADAPEPVGEAPPPGSPPPAPSAPPSPPANCVLFYAQNQQTIEKAKKATKLVVPAGAAFDAQTHMAAALDQLDAAISANNLAGAQAAFVIVQTEFPKVQAAPDPAMLPVTKGAHPDQTLYAKKPSETQDTTVADINQGTKMGDCYLLSTIGEISMIDPAVIKKMVQDNGDGTYTVTFHKHKTGASLWWGKITGNEFEDEKVTVDANFAPGTANAAPGQDEVGGKKETWVQVIEKAYAKFHGGYNKIQGGLPSNAMQELTGKDATMIATGSLSLGGLMDDIKNHKAVVMDTPKEDPAHPLPFGLHAGHAYMLDKVVVGADGKAMVKLINPWGRDNPQLIPFDQLGTGISWVGVGSVK